MIRLIIIRLYYGASEGPGTAGGCWAGCLQPEELEGARCGAAAGAEAEDLALGDCGGVAEGLSGALRPRAQHQRLRLQ